jgi:phosphoglucomutase
VDDGQGWHRPALLSAEITMRIGRDPNEIYRAVTQELSEPAERRVRALLLAVHLT